MRWLVVRWDFDENELQFRKNGHMEFKSDEELLKFIKEVMSQAGVKVLWQITRIKEL